MIAGFLSFAYAHVGLGSVSISIYFYTNRVKGIKVTISTVRARREKAIHPHDLSKGVYWIWIRGETAATHTKVWSKE